MAPGHQDRGAGRESECRRLATVTAAMASSAEAAMTAAEAAMAPKAGMTSDAAVEPTAKATMESTIEPAMNSATESIMETATEPEPARSPSGSNPNPSPTPISGAPIIIAVIVIRIRRGGILLHDLRGLAWRVCLSGRRDRDFRGGRLWHGNGRRHGVCGNRSLAAQFSAMPDHRGNHLVRHALFMHVNDLIRAGAIGDGGIRNI